MCLCNTTYVLCVYCIVHFMPLQVPHEVLPCFNGHRHAVTIWYYDSTERAQAVEQARSLGRSGRVAVSSVQSQREAKDFMTALMDGSSSSSGTSPVKELVDLSLSSSAPTVTNSGDDEADLPSTAEVSALAQRVALLSPEALNIVASITGSPSPESFKSGFGLLTPRDVQSMRRLFNRMGLNQ